MKKLIEPLIAVILIIAVCSVIARVLSGSETLTEYATKNPEIAYATKAPSESPIIDPTPAIESMNQTPELYFTASPLTDEQIDRITGISFPEGDSESIEISYDDLRFLTVLYYDFNGDVQEGELICNHLIASDLIDIFHQLYQNQYQIESIKLVDEFDGNDELSMEANNTSCFNYRDVDGTSSLSKHALGLAIDINPFYNPYVRYSKDGSGSVSITPIGSESYADRTKDFPYKIDENDLCYKLFKEHGFSWGGDWNSSKDYQHFQKSS